MIFVCYFIVFSEIYFMYICSFFVLFYLGRKVNLRLRGYVLYVVNFGDGKENKRIDVKF